MSEPCISLPVLRRPSIGLALGFGLGIGIGTLNFYLPPFWLFVSAAAALFVTVAANCLLLKRPPAAPIASALSGLSGVCIYIALALLGWLSAAIVLHNPSGRELAALMDRPREGVELTGVVTDDPYVSSAWDGTNRIWNFPLRVNSIHRLPQWQAARGTVQVRLLEQPNSRPPQYGERWRLTGVLVNNARYPVEPRPVLEWIKNQYAFIADPTAGVCLAEGQGSRLISWCFRGRRKAADCLARGLEHRPEVAGLLQALLLGYRQELSPKLRNDFVATGTYHIFAISGQHVAILAMFIIVVLQARGVCRVKWFFYVAPLLVLFTLATGLSSSAVRGCLMALLVFLGPLLHRKPDLPSAMALAAVLILAADPFQLFDYGFLLSFGVVAGLMVFCPPLLRPVENWLRPDPWRLEPERPAIQFRRSAARVVALLLVSSFAAWLVSTPLIARWFNLVSPVALLANLVVIPVSTLVLLAGCLSVLCGLFLPWLGEVFNFSNVVLVSFLLWITDVMARIPFGHFYVVSPPVWALFVWFGTMAIWFLKWGRRRLWLLGPAVLAVALVSDAILNWNRACADIRNIGGVLVCSIKGPGTSRVLINAGPRFGSRSVTRALQQQGVNRLSALVLTAADERHAGGAIDLAAAFRIETLWCAATNSRSPIFRQVLASARERNIPIRVFAGESRGARCGNELWQYSAVSNEYRINRGKTVLIFNRDMTAPGQDALDTIDIEEPAKAGKPRVWHIRCVELGEASAETNSIDGDSWTGLAPGQSARIDLE